MWYRPCPFTPRPDARRRTPQLAVLDSSAALAHPLRAVRCALLFYRTHGTDAALTRAHTMPFRRRAARRLSAGVVYRNSSVKRFAPRFLPNKHYVPTPNTTVVSQPLQERASE